MQTYSLKVQTEVFVIIEKATMSTLLASGILGSKIMKVTPICKWSSSHASSFLGPKLLVPTKGSRAFGSGASSNAPGIRAQAQSQKKPPADVIATLGAVPGVRETVWDQVQLAVPSNPKLTRDATADVVVVGAGIAGLSVAYNLAKAGKKVIVLESRAIGAGQTGKTTAHLMPWNDDYYYEIEKNWGTEKLKIVADSHIKSIDFVERVVKEEGIECNFQRVPGYLVATEDNDSEAEKLRMEYEACKRGGIDSVKMINLKHAPENGSFGHGILFPMTAEFQPLKYIQGLAKAIKRMGGEIYEETAVIEQKGEVCKTDAGHTVSGEAVVLATNSPIHKILAIHSRQYARRSYVVGLRVPKGAINRASWWDTASPYHYVRLEDKGDDEILVVGGKDHVVGIEPSDYEDAYGELEAWARAHFPAALEVSYRWTGQVYLPSDFLGLYGKNPLDPGNVYVATGDSGEGMTGGTIGGIVISNLILGKSHPWIDVYSPTRFPAVSPDTLSQQATEIKENIEGFSSLIPGVGVESFSSDTVGRGCGAVIQEGLSTVAIFRDGDGQLHRYSAVCPHLGCAVKWNPKDTTFDCPCHGSQFDINGVVIQGPAKQGLSKLSSNQN